MVGYETKTRLPIKPHIGDVKSGEVTDDMLDDHCRMLETAPCPTNKGKPLGAKFVRHVRNILPAALGAAGPKLNPVNPVNPPATAIRRPSVRSGPRRSGSRAWTTPTRHVSSPRSGSRAATASAARSTADCVAFPCGPSAPRPACGEVRPGHEVVPDRLG